jgi:hypothetical protein
MPEKIHGIFAKRVTAEKPAPERRARKRGSSRG